MGGKRMAANKRVLTLGLNFDLDRQNIQKITQTLNDTAKVKLSSKRSDNYLKSALGDVDEYLKQYKALVKEMQKPIHSKSQARELGYRMGNLNTDIKQRVGGLKGSVSRIYNTPKNAQNFLDVSKVGDQIKAVQDLIDKIKELRKERGKIGTNKALDTQRIQAKTELKGLSKKDSLTPTELARQKELNNVLDDVNKKLKEKEAIQARINALLQASGYSSVSEAEGQRDELIKQQSGLREEIITPEDSAALEKSLTTILNLLKEIGNASHTVDELGDAHDRAAEEARKNAEQEKTFKDVLSQLGLPLLTLNEIAGKIRQVIDYSFEYVKNLDKALTEIAVVSDKTRQEALRLTDTFIELASKTGMAIDDIAQASTIFYQQGLADDAVKKLTEYTAVFAKISGEDVPTAADQLTAAINGFGWSADRVGDVVDKLSVLAAYSAADTQELATAMSKAASQASMAGLSFDQYNAYLATMIETTREAPENIGTSLKTIMSRFQSIKSGDNTEDDTDVNAVETALKSVGVQLRDSQGQLRELGDVLDELGPKWAGLDRNTQAYLGTVIAGTRQQSRFISLMQHWDRALELQTASENSAGAAAEMHAKAMEGLDATINNLTIAWQDLISTIVNGDTFKGILKIITGVIKWLGDGNSLLKVIFSIITLVNAKTLITNAQIISQNQKLGSQKETLKNIDTTWSSIKEKVSSTVTAIKTAVAATDELTAATNKLNNTQNGGGADVNATQPTTGDNAQPSTGGSKLGNVVGMLGKVQSAIAIFTTVAMLAETISGWISKALFLDAEELSAIEDSINKRQEEIDKQDSIIRASTTTLEIYNKINKKMNLTTDELDDLSEAAKSVAKAIPEAVMGYDENGNPIINQAVAKSAGANANAKKAELAKDQIGELIYKDIAESVVNASTEYQNSSTHKWATAGKFAGGAAAGLGLTALLNIWNPFGWATGIAAIVAAIGSAVAIGSSVGDAAKENAAKMKAAAKDIKSAFSDENMEAVQKHMAQISKAAVGQGTIDNTTAEDRTKTAGSLASSWISNEAKRIQQSFFNGDIGVKKMKEQVEDLGYEWEATLNKLGGTQGLAKITNEIAKAADGVGDKTYASLEEGFQKFVDSNYSDLDKNSELYKSLKDAFMKAALEGTSGGLLSAVDLLEGKIEGLTGQKGQEGTLKKYQDALAKIKGMTTKEADMYGSSGILDNIDLFNKVYSQSGKELSQKIATSAEQPSLDFIEALTRAKYDFYNEAQQFLEDHNVTSADDLDDKLKVQYNEIIDNAEAAKNTIENIWNSMSYSPNNPWSLLLDDLEKINKQGDNTRQVLAKLISGDGIDYSTFKTWATETLDVLDTTQMSTEQLNRLSGIYNQITNSLYVQNGQLRISQEATQALVDLQEELAQAEIEKLRRTYQVRQQELQAEKLIVDAQIATLKEKLEMGDSEIDAEAAWNDARAYMTQLFQETQEDAAQNYVDIYNSAYAKDLENWNKLQTAKINGTEYKGESLILGDILKPLNKESYLKALKKAGMLDNREALQKALDERIHRSQEIQTELSSIEFKLSTLKFGTTFTEGAAAVADAAKELEKYQGELEEIYNTLRKIEGLQARLNNLDQYENIAIGGTYAKYIHEKIDLTQELIEHNKTLLAQQKYLEQHEQDLIKSSSVGDVFSFDEFNNIIINWEKYNELQDESIDGEMTLKELADKLYDEYKDLHDTTLDYYSDLVDSVDQAIQAQQKLIDTYNDLENQLANAVKDIYQKMLDTKLDAIDTEIEALDKLREAREKANKERDNSRELSNLQTSLKRAMMDTSGASNTKVLSYQDQIRSKLEEMGEDEYTERLDAIKEALNDQKEFLQKEFNDYFEDWQEFHKTIEERVLGNKTAVEEVLKTTDEFKKGNEAQRAKLMQDLMTKYETVSNYVRGGTEGGSTIMDVFENITNTKKSIEKIDGLLRDGTFTQQVGTSLSNALKDYMTSQFNALAGRLNSQNTTYSPSPSPEPKKEPASPGAVGDDSAQKAQIQADNRVPKSVTLLKSEPGRLFNITNGGRMVSPVAGDRTTFVRFKKGSSYTVSGMKEINGVKYYKINSGSSSVWIKASDTTNAQYKKGGLADFTGPAWLDGTKSNPEAVLDAAQTKAFMSFTDKLAKLDAMNALGGGVVNIESISFEVDSMSSPEDGEKAFDAFVQRFKEVGKQSGLSFVKNRL